MPYHVAWVFKPNQRGLLVAPATSSSFLQFHRAFGLIWLALLVLICSGFSTQAQTLEVTGSTYTVDGSLSVTGIHITDGIVAVNENGSLELQLGPGDGLTFSGNGSPQIVLTSSDTSPGAFLLGQDVVVDSSLTAGTATIVNDGTGLNSGYIDLLGGARQFTINDGADSVDLGISATITNGGLIKAGAGTLLLTSSNSYAGGTTLNAGTLQAGDDSALGTGLVTLNGGTLSSASTDPRTIANNLLIGGNITLGDATNNGALTFSGTSVGLNGATRQLTILAEVTLAGALSNGGITKAGNEILHLTGTNTYTGPTTISAGTLEIAGSGNLGASSYSGDISNNGTLAFNTSSDQTLSGVISGSGDLTKDNTGTLTLTGTNTYTGATSITGGTLEIGGSGSLGEGSYSADISNDGILSLNTAANQTLSGVLSGNGSLVKANSGTLTLTASNSFAGGVTLNAGTLQVGNDSALGTGVVTLNGGSLSSNSTDPRNLANDLLIGGDVSLGNATNNGALTFSGTSVDLNGASRQLTILSEVTLAGVLDNGGLIKAGTATLHLTGTSTYTGPTTISAGTLEIAGSGNLGNSNYAGDISNNGTLAFNTASDQTLSGRISGSGDLTKDSTGTLILTGSNAYSGGTTINSGAVQIGNDSALGSGLITMTGGQLSSDSAVDRTLANNLAIAGDITLGDATNNGVLGLMGAVDLSGTIRQITAASDVTITGVVSNGGLSKAGAATLLVTGTNTYTGITTITSGTLEIGGSGSLENGTYAADIANDGTLSINTRANQTLSGVLSGNGSLVKANSGTLTLTASNSFAGGVTLHAGTLQVGDDSALGTGLITLNGGSLSSDSTDPRDIANSLLIGGDVTLGDATNNGSLIFSGTTVDLNGATRQLTILSEVTLAGALNHGGLIKAGSATLQLTGTNTYTGSTTISDGTLEIAGAGNLGNSNYAGSITNDGTLAFNTSSNQTLSGVISGSGDLTKDNTGSLTLTGSNTYSGGTTLNSGAIEIGNDSALGSGLLTMTGGQLSSDSATARMLANNLAIGGDITLGDATSNGSLGLMGAVDLSGSLRQITVASNVTIAGEISNGGFIKAGTATLLLTGTNTYTGSTAIASGTLEIGGSGSLGSGNYSAAFSDDGTLFINTSANQTLAGILSGNGSLIKGNTGTLTLTANNSFAGGVTLNAGTLQVGDDSALGTGLVTLNGGSLSSNSTDARNLSNDLLIGGDVTLGSAINNGALTFSGTSVDLNGATRQLTILSEVTLAGALRNGGLVKAGNATLHLTGTNTYTGPTTISTGTLEIAGDGNLGNSSYAGNIFNNGTLAFNTTSDQTLSGNISGSGDLTKDNSGTLILSGSNTYSGGTTINSGVVQIGNDSALGSGLLTMAGGQLSSDSAADRTLANNLAVTGDITLGDATNSGLLGLMGTVDLSGTIRQITVDSDVTITGVVSNGGLTKAGAATLLLTGTNTYTGPTSITSGTLEIGGSGSLGNGNYAADIANYGTLSFNTSSDQTLSGVLSGNGNLVKGNSGTLTLSANNSFAGGVTLNDGTLQVGDDSALGTGLATLNGGTLSSNSTDARNIANDLLIGGDVTLGDATNNGALTFSGTSLDLNGATRQLTILSDVTFAGALDNGGLIKTGSATLHLTGTNTYGGSTTITDGTLEIGGAGNLGNSVYAGDISNDGTLAINTTSDQTLSGLIYGSGNLTKDNTGTLTLTGSNTYSGGTTINSGEVQIGNDSALGSALITMAGGQLSSDSVTDRTLSNDLAITGNITLGDATNNGVLGIMGSVDLSGTIRQITVDSDVTITGIVSNGGLTKAGAATLLLTGTNTYTGSTAIASGTLEIGGSGNLGSGTYAGDIANDGTLSINTSANQILSGVISGNGNLIKDNSGTLVLTNANTYDGGTLLADGVLQIGNDTALGTGPLTMEGGVFSSNSTQAHTLSNALFVNGDVTLGDQIDNGTLTFTGPVDLGGITPTFTINSDVEFAGTVDNGGLTKAGSARLTLSGVNPYTGATSVLAGTLNVAGSLIGTSSVSVASGATLNVNGSINNSAVTSVAGILSGTGSLGQVSISDGGLLAPGNGTGAGILKVGALDFSGAAAKLQLKLGGTTAGIDQDQIQTDGPLSLNGATLQLSLLNGYRPKTTDQLLLILNGDSSQTDIGQFAGLADNSIVKLSNDLGTFKFKLHYGDVDSNGSTDVYLSGSTAIPVKWGPSGSDALGGILDGSLIPTTTGSNGLRYSNVYGLGFDVVVVTQSLNQVGASTLPWDGSYSWWIEGQAASSGGKTIPYSTVEFHFYKAGTNVPFGVTGIKFRFEDAENGERFRNFGYWNSRGTKFLDAFYDPSIFTFASGAPILHQSDGNSIDSGSPYAAGTQSGKWIEVDLSAMAISGFTFQSGRYDSSSGSFLMTGLGSDLQTATELLIQSGADQAITTGPDFAATAADSTLTPTSLLASLASHDVTVTSLASQNITLNNSITSTSGHSLALSSQANIASIASTLSTSVTSGNSGNISLTASNKIAIPQIQSTASAGRGGDITLTADDSIKIITGIDSSSSSTLGHGGNISLSAFNDLVAGTIRSGNQGVAGNISLQAGNLLQVKGVYAPSSAGTGSLVTLAAPTINLGSAGAVAANISGTMVLEKNAWGTASTISITGTLKGAGDLNIDAGTGVATLNTNGINTGKTVVNSGTLAMQGHSLASSALTLNNRASLVPGIATNGASITLQSLTLGLNTTFSDKLTSALLYDQTRVTGAANLNGIFNLTLGVGYTPSLGTSIPVMNFGSSTGDFGAYQGLRLSSNLVLQPEFDATHMWLLATTVPPAGVNPLQTVPSQGISLSVGDSYDGLTVASAAPSLITNATLVGGTASQSTTVMMSLVATGTAGLQAGAVISGYILNLQGTHSDMFVLVLDYSESAALAAVGDERNMFISSSDGGPFVNAVLLNTGPDNQPTQFSRAFNPQTDFHLGYYGIDTVNNRVWAVLNHNSSFGLGVQNLPKNSPAMAVTQSATGITATSGTLNALVDPHGTATCCYFEYGMMNDLSDAAPTAVVNSGSGYSLLTVSTAVSALSPQTTYYFRANTVTASGTQTGQTLWFTTPPPPPVVTVSALVKDAYELGALSGQFQISQSGSSPLTVKYTLSGTSGNGTRYSIPNGPITIPNGASSITLNLTPIPNNVYDGDQPVTLTIQPDSAYTVANPSSATIVVHDKPMDRWKSAVFGNNANLPSKSADNAVNNQAGITNLVAYGLGIDPLNARVSDLPTLTMADASNSNYLALNFTRNASATDVVYVLQASNDLKTWVDISTCRGGAWSGQGNVTETNAGGVLAVQARDSVPLSANPSRFLRLIVTH